MATILLCGVALGEPFYWRYTGAVPVFIGCLLVALSSSWGGGGSSTSSTDEAAVTVTTHRWTWVPRRRAHDGGAESVGAASATAAREPLLRGTEVEAAADIDVGAPCI